MPGSFLRELLEQRRVAVAESCTGGLVAQALAAIPGSGDWFRGGVVAYHPQVKFDVLGVTPGPVVTATAAREMAVGAAKLLDADVAIAVTGVAGPDSQDGVPVGTVFIACCASGRSKVGAYGFDGHPAEVCKQARNQALQDLASLMVMEPHTAA